MARTERQRSYRGDGHPFKLAEHAARRNGCHVLPCRFRGRAALNTPPMLAPFPGKLFSATPPHGGVPAHSETEGGGGVLAAGGATAGGGDEPMPRCYAAPERTVPAPRRYCAAPERPVPVPAPQGCCGFSNCTTILAGQPVTMTQLHAAPETAPPPPGPAASFNTIETSRLPPPEAGWPGPKDTPTTAWSLATPSSGDVLTPPIQFTSGGRAPPPSQPLWNTSAPLVVVAASPTLPPWAGLGITSPGALTDVKPRCRAWEKPLQEARRAHGGGKKHVGMLYHRNISKQACLKKWYWPRSTARSGPPSHQAQREANSSLHMGSEEAN